jgi:multicomponent Na+:H+ antiporter subunit G
MMDLALDILSWIFLVAGSVFALIGAVGIIRLPDVFSRMHGAGIIDTAGASLILIGLAFQAGLTLVTVKLLLIIVFLMFTSPTSTHALARAALNGGVKPLIDDAPETDQETDQEPLKT